MIDSFQIFNKADSIVKKVGTRDPLAIADELGIKIYYGDYKELLGMYTYLWKQRIVLLNNSLDDYWRQIVLAHEIGHDIYHRNLAKDGLKEFTLFKTVNSTEYVANAFAAHLLLDNDDVLELARDGYDPAQIASFLNSDTNLMLIKLYEMNRMGYNFNIPCHPERNFFKKIKI